VMKALVVIRARLHAALQGGQAACASLAKLAIAGIAPEAASKAVGALATV